MTSPSQKPILSGQMQLNLIGAGLVVLLGLSAWVVSRHFTLSSVIPLGLIGYAMFRVVYELTFNRKNVPTLATGIAARGKITQILQLETEKRGDKPYTIIDLGSGRGELTRFIARAIPHATVIGIEMAKIPFWQSVMLQRWFGPKNLSYQCLDFFPYDCSHVDAVVFYLSGPFARRVGEKLWNELQPGALVISHTFALEAPWQPAEVLNFRSPFKEVIYVYRKTNP